MGLREVLEGAAAVVQSTPPPPEEPPLRAVYIGAPRAITTTPAAVLVPMATDIQRGGALRRLRHTVHIYVVLPPAPDAQTAQRRRELWVMSLVDTFDRALALGGAASRAQVERVEHGTITVAGQEFVVANLVLVAWEEQPFAFQS
jgi:hypothetical protein